MADGQTKLELILSAIDRTKGAWDSIQGRMRGFDNVARGTAIVGKGVGMAVAGGMVAAQAAIGATTLAFSKLQEGFQGAMDSQTSQFSTASGLVGAFGLTFDEATASIDRMTESLVKQAKILPGSAGDYVKLSRAISDDVGAAFVDATGKISDIGGFEKALGSISASVGALGVTSKTDTNNVGLSLSRALGGASRAQLNELAFFQNNRSFLNLVDKTAGGMELSDMSVQERVKVIEKVAKQLAGSDEYLKRSGQLLDSKISTLMSDLFDSDFGLFGLNRGDFDPLRKGKQSVLTAIGDTFDRVFGEGGIVTKLDRIFKSLKFDPMLALYDGIQWINGKIDALLPYLEQAAAFVDAGGSIGDLFRLLPIWFGGMVQRITDRVLGAFQNFDVEKFFTMFREMLGNVVNGLTSYAGKSMDMLNQVFQRVDFGQVGLALGVVIGDLVVAIIDYIFKFPWDKAMEVLARGSWNVLQFLLGLILGIVGRILQALGGVIAPAYTQLWNAIGSFINEIVAKITGFFSSLQQKVTGAFTAITTGNMGYFAKPISEGAQGYETLARGGARYQGNIPDAFAKFQGHIPAFPASGGLFEAIATEMRNKPSGSSLAIANTSEAIIPAGMMKGMFGGRGATNYNTFNIQSSDPKAVAQEVLAILESLSQSGVNANLAYDFT